MSKEGELLENEYLWDGSGEPDAAVVKLERALGKFRHAGRAPELPEGLAEARASKKTLRGTRFWFRSEEHTSELQSHLNLVCRLLLEKKKYALNLLARRLLLIGFRKII